MHDREYHQNNGNVDRFSPEGFCCREPLRCTPALSVLFLSWTGDVMLTTGKMVGFIATNDYDKARAFYEGKLGFEFLSLDQFALVMRAGEHKIRISKVSDFAPFHGTVLGWEVNDIEAVVTWLRDRGVSTEKYPFVPDQELGIWTAPSGDKVAWFKDPDGNVLSVSYHP
jgi:catechol 2,3-dioxygenase-like lactoylglutathione lyase family enzyme